MTLGSLFDGIGGFPLAGMMHGIEPVWASEIEPFPILVTRKRFPAMQHLGSVTQIDGAKIPPVDVITFGSPCQDLSVAGKQKGIHEGERSNLFFEAVRIIREMRANDRAAGRADEHVRPRFAVWENVQGAFSSNKGQDFRAVLQALCEVADPDVYVPEPPRGKWKGAGCIVGDGYSVAWRVYDAQHWGVPQRRKRIYLVADFGSEHAGEILFERESMRRDSASSREAWERTAEDTQGGAGGSCFAFHLQQDTIYGTVSPCIGGQHQATVGVFMGGQGAKAGGIAYDETASPTLRSTPSGSNQVPDVIYAAGFNDSLGERAQGGMEYSEDCAPTLRAGDVRAVVYDARGNGAGGCHRRYIVRRLTPLECCRLQGYPDGWTQDVAIPEPTEKDIAFFAKVWEWWGKPKMRKQIIKWLKDPQTDSAEYKAYGNSLAIPCAADVIGRVAGELRKGEPHETDADQRRDEA